MEKGLKYSEMGIFIKGSMKMEDLKGLENIFGRILVVIKVNLKTDLEMEKVMFFY